MIQLLNIDPSLRASGLVLLSERATIMGVWTVRGKSTVPNLVPNVDNWCAANLRNKDSLIAAVELPPPRVQKRTYQLEPALVAGIWIHALKTRGIEVDVIPAWDWQKAILGPKEDWPNGSSKAMAALICKGFNIALPNEHTRDAYCLGRYVLKRNRISALQKRISHSK